MAKPNRTNNDWLMQRTGLLIVYAWVLLAVGFFGLTAWDMKYLDNSEQYVSILAIIGGPALLIVTKILETWNQEKLTYEGVNDEYVTYYRYSLEKYPHAGAGTRVQF